MRQNNFYVAKEGAYANRPRPDLIVLDLNMPHMDGRQLLGVLKCDTNLQSIPVVVQTTSANAEPVILKRYKLQANCFIAKPVDLVQFMHVVRAIEYFRLYIIKLPPKNE